MKKYLLILMLSLFAGSLSAKNLSAIWVVRDMLSSPDSIDEIVDYAIRNRIDILFVQVRGRGTVYYNSAYEESALGDSDFDPLKYILQKTEGTDIKVHAWFNLYLVWSDEEKPKSPLHPLNKFPNAILKDLEFNTYSYARKKTIEGYYLSPFHPGVNEYLIQMVKELVLKYPVSGIHFDYIRYPNANFIVEDNLLAYISNKYGFSPLFLKKFPDSAAVRYSDDKYYANLEKLKNFYSKAITLFLRQVSDWINRSAPSVMISAAVKPDPVKAKVEYYQDWITWLNKNYLDFVVVMNYSKNNSDFLNNLKKIKELTDYSRVMVGLAVFNKSWDKVRQQINIAEENRFGALAFFSYKHLKNHPIKYYIY